MNNVISKHRLLIYLIIFFLLLNRQSYAADTINYLSKVAEQNINWINIILKAIACLIAFIGLAFGTILIIVIKQLKEISDKIKITDQNIKQIESHERKLIFLADEVTDIKNLIRDAKLNERKLDESQIAKLSEKVFGRKEVRLVNILKDLIWRENIEDINQLDGLTDQESKNEIKDECFKEKIILNDVKLTDWLYKIKVKKEPLRDLLEKEKRSQVSDDEMQKAFVKYLDANWNKFNPK